MSAIGGCQSRVVDCGTHVCDGTKSFKVILWLSYDLILPIKYIYDIISKAKKIRALLIAMTILVYRKFYGWQIAKISSQ